MNEFNSKMSFDEFSESVSQRRYIRNVEQEEFLASVLETSESRKKELPKDFYLWRAQVGHGWDEYETNGEKDGEECPFDKERMKPLKYKASEGRVNPKGIPCLYAATDAKTAIGEVRPWVGASVSVAKLKVINSLTLVNCTKDYGETIVYFHELDAKDREREVWKSINQRFSMPVVPNEYFASYVPTQIIAEMLKQNGFDGLVFKSSLGSGYNVALFDLNAAEVIECGLFHISSVDFQHISPDRWY